MRYLLVTLVCLSACLGTSVGAYAQDKAAPAKPAPTQKEAPAKTDKAAKGSKAAKDFDLDAMFKKGEQQIKEGNHCGPKTPKEETPVA